ncbi:S-adenosyl-L-methionine-dependent methyltransferase [Mycobacterium sp. 852013-51886_SCH5428379]|uniref:YceI family protein n=1 Tax=Mycobacterium sp. 852013-51886_SCH5428379 TaxID=1834111 RepID=UPI0007FD7101|nr:YceI family protein [Mycobacterium sp. 852013-51886_SCH5428379]OBB57081.1 S-adenosyl-L-methionine-dependent methyltransferase [Mycobacterium sp. 852013-51886_SCH5428379]
MTATDWVLDPSHGELLATTGVAGRAAKMGHRLTIAFRSWRMTISWEDDEPVGAELVVEVDSLEVVRGEGGVTPLTGPEKAVARTFALSTFDASRYPTITFRADAVEDIDGGYRLSGTLEVHGKTRPKAIDVHVEDLGEAWRVSGEAEVRHTDFGMKPYSMMMGTMKVADTVLVSLQAECAKD